MSEKKKGYLLKDTPVAVTVSSLLGAICFICSVIACYKTLNNSTELVVNICEALISGFLLAYLFALYDVPHDNTLRYVFLSFAVYLAVCLIQTGGNKLVIGLTTFIIIGVSYVSGRLSKREKNTYIIIVVLIGLIVRSCLLLSDATDLLSTLNIFAPCLFWLSIGLTYVTKFEAHIKAGQNN